MRDRLPNHWGEMLGPEAEQVNESARVEHIFEVQLVKHRHLTQNAPGREAGASCLKASGTKTAHPPEWRVQMPYLWQPDL